MPQYGILVCSPARADPMALTPDYVELLDPCSSRSPSESQGYEPAGDGPASLRSDEPRQTDVTRGKHHENQSDQHLCGRPGESVALQHRCPGASAATVRSGTIVARAVRWMRLLEGRHYAVSWILSRLPTALAARSSV